MVPHEVYADGGVARVNPSPFGGMWAWCHVRYPATPGGTPSPVSEVVRSASGVVRAGELMPGPVSNNLTEFLALLLGLEALPDGWSGLVCSDSGVTLGRFERHHTAGMKGIPPALVGRLTAVRARLGGLTFRLLGGHPTRADLDRGRRKDGKPVSPHNVWCDRACGERAAELVGR